MFALAPTSREIIPFLKIPILAANSISVLDLNPATSLGEAV